MRDILDAIENFDGDTLRELEDLIKDEDGPVKAVVSLTSDISQVLDKIQSTIPVKKEVQKYFAKDGKVIK